MDFILPLENKKPSDEKLLKTLQAKLSEGERELFRIVTDLSPDGNYGDSVVEFTDKKITAVYHGESGEVESLSVSYDEIDGLSIKRMYGNAFLLAIMKSGKKAELARATYAVTALFNAAVLFADKIIAGTPIDEAVEGVETAYRSFCTVCPKCGRKLVRPGADCLNCASKGRLVSKLAKYVKPEIKPIILSVIMSVVITALSLVPPYVTKMLVDDIIPNKNKKMLYIIVAFLFGTYLMQYLIGAIRGALLRRAGDSIVADLRNDVFEKAQHLPMKFYDKTSTGSVINRISNDTSNLQSFILRITQEVITQLFLLVGIIIIMITMNWKLSLLSLIPVPFVVYASKKFGRKIRPFYRRIWRKWTAVSSVLTDSIPCIRVVKSFSGEKRASNRLEKQNREWLKVSVRAGKMSSIFTSAVSFVVVCGSLIIWNVGGLEVIEGKSGISLGLLVSFISYTSMFYGPVNFFAGLNDSYQSALTSAERVMDILDAEPEHDDGKGNMPERINGKVEFRHVSFSFDKTKNVLSDINLTIEPGEAVGIVGTTGSGKTTLINLFMRFYETDAGTITVDGRSIRNITRGSLRASFGMVLQDTWLKSGTVRENIAMGKPDATDAEIEAAARASHAHSFIKRLPQGYDTVLSEDGSQLSQGQKQLLCISRVMLALPPMLILDEATSSIDTRTEIKIQKAFAELMRGRTSFIVAHRLNTIKNADLILVMKDGKIIERGTHDELMSAGGFYADLYGAQFRSVENV